ncbi:MAG: DUF4349 domain-containing protein [Pyrinomonadaceae bacterium]
MKELIPIALLVVTFTLAGCTGGGATASNSTGSTAYKGSSDSPSLPRDVVSTQPATTGSGAGSGIGGGGGGGAGGAKRQVIDDKISLSQATNSQSPAAQNDRKIIRNGTLAIECDRPEDAQRNISDIANSNGGYVVDTEQTMSDPKSQGHDSVSMTIRVPSDKFETALDQIRSSSGKIIKESIKGDDVTEEFIDIEARLKAKQALEQQFMEIMKRANSVDDALSVQSQLADVRSDIEKIQGRKRFLENQSSLSTIKIQLQTPAVFSASSKGFGERLTQAFGSGFDFALEFVLGLVTFVVAILPFAILVGMPAFLFIRYFIKRQKRARTTLELAEEELKAAG